ncbi:hypothetical protein MKK75_30515 [Methylobacterium sp. J-030]|uniref:TylF/MycF/NovP-related O-methyltransferase n=1 Tax=Methylobacterium sp. J-030 TaxID=2836627 RepID=UPI001FBB7F9B|nr:TylF/MycF/NovP-related O-methyltransferase [Methylobacterium sp. J-030]MCJ2073079.1 hypothetical protein [Methylobacterium sp. J-030]
MTATFSPHSRTPSSVAENRQRLLDLYGNSPLPPEQVLTNLGLYLRSGPLAKILLLDELYREIVDIPGAIIEFGCWWGQALAVFENLRAIHEPYNHSRRIVGFDTFQGYQTLNERDKPSDVIRQGNYSVSDAYTSHLEAVLDFHEHENRAASQVKKCSIRPGDVAETVPKYFQENPQTIVALAYFDFAIYEPTKLCLQNIKNRLIRGSVIAFDELNDADYPGETIALIETLGLRAGRIRKSRFLPDRTYMTID